MALIIIWAVTAVAVGLLMGRFILYRWQDAREEMSKEPAPVPPRQKKRGRGRKCEEEPAGYSVGSPVSGEVLEQGEGEHPTVVIHSDDNKLYAPAGGKITRLYPMGNAMLFTTEFGAEIYIEAGKTDDELLNRYYRPKIVQNEVVGKGKLLLEFDRQGLEAEGVAPDVAVCVEGSGSGIARLIAGEWVKAGQEILKVRTQM